MKSRSTIDAQSSDVLTQTIAEISAQCNVKDVESLFPLTSCTNVDRQTPAKGDTASQKKHTPPEREPDSSRDDSMARASKRNERDALYAVLDFNTSGGMVTKIPQLWNSSTACIKNVQVVAPLGPEQHMASIKHKVIVRPVADIYQMLGRQHGNNKREDTRRANAAANSSVQRNTSGHGHQSALNQGKRRRRDAHLSESDEDEDVNKRRTRHPRRQPLEDSRRLACPFNKFDSAKYSVNNETGVLYRTCMGPGCQKVSDVK